MKAYELRNKTDSYYRIKNIGRYRKILSILNQCSNHGLYKTYIAPKDLPYNNTISYEEFDKFMLDVGNLLNNRGFKIKRQYVNNYGYNEYHISWR